MRVRGVCAVVCACAGHACVRGRDAACTFVVPGDGGYLYLLGAAVVLQKRHALQSTPEARLARVLVSLDHNFHCSRCSPPPRSKVSVFTNLAN